MLHEKYLRVHEQFSISLEVINRAIFLVLSLGTTRCEIPIEVLTLTHLPQWVGPFGMNYDDLRSAYFIRSMNGIVEVRIMVSSHLPEDEQELARCTLKYDRYAKTIEYHSQVPEGEPRICAI